jgi:hypothetical protein
VKGKVFFLELHSRERELKEQEEEIKEKSTGIMFDDDLMHRRK